MKITSEVKISALIMSSLAVLACGSDVPQTLKAFEQQTSAKLAKSSINDGWIQAAQKHNHSGLSMRFRLEGSLAVGQPVTIFFEFAGARASDARVSMTPAKALSLGSLGSFQKQGDALQQSLKVGEVTSQSITVTPSSEGAHFIGFQLTQNGQTSSTGIMLRIGQAGQSVESIGEVVTTDSGEKLILMPAK